jgi:surfeit locus 1 family protein
MITFRKPEILPTLFFLAAFAVCITLGGWQLERLSWKEQVIAESDKAKELPALGTLPAEVGGLTYCRVALTGTFQNEKAIHLIGRQQGMDVGYYIVTPLVLEDDGRIILVDRGFSPLGKETQPEGLVTVEGMLRPLRQHRYFAPKNSPEKNIWSYEDLNEIEAFIGQRPLPLVVEATGKPEKNVFPIPNEGKVIFRNDHLGYAITWFALAITSLVMFGAYYRKK